LGCFALADPEGLFCITSSLHQIPLQGKSGGIGKTDEHLEGTRGILPENMEERELFIAKFNAALAIAKAKVSGNTEEWTARLHVAGLEMICNVFTESQYREFTQQRGDIALFYTMPAVFTNSSSNSNANANGLKAKNHGQYYQKSLATDLMSFKRLPAYVGLIQQTAVAAAESMSPSVILRTGIPPIAASARVTGDDAEDIPLGSGFRMVMKSKVSLNGFGNATATAEDSNLFLDTDSFQTHMLDLSKLDRLLIVWVEY
jgi:hypothetical protein